MAGLRTIYYEMETKGMKKIITPLRKSIMWDFNPPIRLTHSHDFKAMEWVPILKI